MTSATDSAGATVVKSPVMPPFARGPLGLVAALLAGSLAACTSSEPPATPCWTSLDAEAPRDLQQLAWTAIGDPALDGNGISEGVEVPLGAEARWLALRVSDPAGGSVCTQLDEVVDPEAAAWVTPPASLQDYRSYCQSCPERVSVGVGSGFYVLPSGDPPPPQAASLMVRAAARDCATFLPAMPGAGRPDHLRIEALALPQIDDAIEGTVLLEVVITEGSIFHDDADALPKGLLSALAGVNDLLAPGKLKVRAVRVRRSKGEDPLAIQRGDHAALERVHAEAHACDEGGAAPDATWVPLVLTGCLELSDPVQMTSGEPNGFTPRIPDGLAPARRAQGLFIKGRGCDAMASKIDWPPETLARLITHELGHYLGLYHTVESDGGTDALADTDADNVMHWVSPTKKLTAGQFRVMRRHPAVRWN